MGVRSLADIDVQSRTVLVRVDFNVPLREGQVQDDTRIQAALPTIRHLRDSGARVRLVSHLGRPKGEPDPQYSLRPVADCLADLLGTRVVFVDSCLAQDVQPALAGQADGDVALLENTRFYPGETSNDAAFAAELATGVDVYINDAFGAAHRAHASTEGVAHLVSDAAAGFLVLRELEYLQDQVARAERPFVAILGGAKVSDKIPVIERLMERVDHILIGGAMAYTFLHAQGISTGKSMVEDSMLELSRDLLDRARQRGVGIHLPVDHLVGRDFSEVTEKSVTDASAIGDGWMGLDIGSRTVEAYSAVIASARTVLWNGPMGVFEWKSFAEGTYAIARAMAANSGAVTIVGGGDSVSAVNRSGLADRMSHISTGGGASLELLEGRELPGIGCLQNAGIS